MKKSLLIPLFLFLLGCSFKEVTIDGTVTHKATQQPIQGVGVVSGNVPTDTDVNGYFSIRGEVVGEGDIKLFFTKQGLQPYTRIVKIVRDEKSDTLGPSETDSHLIIQMTNE